MSGNSDPVCTRCKATSSLIWQRDQKGAVICLECHSTEKSASKTPSFGSEPQASGKQSSVHKTSLKISQPASSSSSSSSSSLADVSVSGVTTRRTTRSHERAKAKQQQLQQESVSHKLEDNERNIDDSENASIDELQSQDKSKSVVSDLLNKCTPQDGLSSKAEVTTMQSPVYAGGPPSPGYSTSSRRNLRQGQPVQAPRSQPYILTCSSVQHQGTVYEVGDIVSLLDRDGGIYYALVRGFLCDQYANKFTVLTWLLPTQPNPTHFDPALFIIGPEEDTPRSMDHIEFVCHSPQSRHFQNSYSHNLELAELWQSAIK